MSLTSWGERYPKYKSVLCVITILIIWEDVLCRVTWLPRALRSMSSMAIWYWIFFFFIPPKDTQMPQSDASNDSFLAEMEVIPHRINVAMCLLCAEHCATCCKRELKGHSTINTRQGHLEKGRLPYWLKDVSYKGSHCHFLPFSISWYFAPWKMLQMNVVSAFGWNWIRAVFTDKELFDWRLSCPLLVRGVL